VTDTEAVLALIAAWLLTTDADAVAVFAEQDATTLWGSIESTAQRTHSPAACAWRLMTPGQRREAVWAAIDAVEKAVMDPETVDLTL
jgi:hypothetical protein